MPLISGKGASHWPQQGRARCGRAASPCSLIYELRSFERGVPWSEKRSSRCSFFCDDPNAPESARPFSTPEEIFAHLQVFHRQFEYSLDKCTDFCRIIVSSFPPLFCPFVRQNDDQLIAPAHGQFCHCVAQALEELDCAVSCSFRT